METKKQTMNETEYQQGLKEAKELFSRLEGYWNTYLAKKGAKAARRTAGKPRDVRMVHDRAIR